MIYTERFEQALVFANKIHNEQLRKISDTPYIGHLLGVASIVIEHGGNEDEAIAALLHDAIEDQGGATAREEIRRRFGTTVTDIVSGCTDSEAIPKPSWRKCKEDYIARISTLSPSSLLVSSSDKLQNSRATLEEYRIIGDQVWDRFKGKKEGTLWYYCALINAYRSRVFAITDFNPQIQRIIQELDFVITELEQLSNK
jgi:(p)ppGpp synthase/HD superfamily hydrolase